MSNVSFIPGFVSLSFYVLITRSVTGLVPSCGFARLYERSYSFPGKNNPECSSKLQLIYFA